MIKCEICYVPFGCAISEGFVRRCGISKGQTRQ